MRGLDLCSEVMRFWQLCYFQVQKKLDDGFSHSQQSREPQRITVLICMRERRVERKWAKATLFLCLTVPQVGFMWWKVIIIYLQIKWTHSTCPYTVLPRKSPTQSLFANVLWQAKLPLLKLFCSSRESALFHRQIEQDWVRGRGKEGDHDFFCSFHESGTYAGLLNPIILHNIHSWLSEISSITPILQIQQLRLRGANDGIRNWIQVCLVSKGYASSWVSWFATQT